MAAKFVTVKTLNIIMHMKITSDDKNKQTNNQNDNCDTNFNFDDDVE